MTAIFTSIVDFFRAAPGYVLAGLAWMVDHPAVGIPVALVAVTVAVTFYLHMRAWRRNGA